MNPIGPLVPALFLAAAIAAEPTIVDPNILEQINQSVSFAESFEGADAAEFGRSVEGFLGKGVATREAKQGPTFSTDVLNPAAGAIAWWARYDFDCETTTPVFSLDQSGPLYINFFGRHGSSDPRHSNVLGQYWNLLGGTDFVSYPQGIKPREWHQFVFTWNGDLTEFFLDSFPSGAQTPPRPFSELKTKTFTLGGGGNDYVFDEVRVFNRALSKQEIQVLWRAAQGSEALRKMSLRAPERLAVQTQSSLRVAYRLSDHTVQFYLFPSTPNGNANVTLAVANPQGREVARQVLKGVKLDGLFHASVPVGDLPDGQYTATLTAGEERVAAVFGRVREEWENNSIGVTDRVIDPWTPISVKKLTARCWGREYEFGALGLPRQILSTQPEPSRGAATRPLLAAPVQLAIDLETGPVAFKTGDPVLRQRSEAYVDVNAGGEAKDLSIATQGTLEFDGFYKFTLRIAPKHPIKVASIRLEIPLPDERTRLFHAANTAMRSNKALLDLDPSGDGELWNSVTGVSVPDGRWGQKLIAMNKPWMIGNLYPYVWLGDDDRGIAFMTDNDRGWVVDPERPCLDLVRKAGQTRLRIHLVNTPTQLSQPVEAALSLQATPIRPRPAGGSWKKVEWYGWGYFDEPVIFDGCFKGIDKPGDPAPRAWYRTTEARKTNRWWKYGCLQTHRVPPEDPVFGGAIARTSDEWGAGIHVPSHRDFLLWAYRQWADRAGLKGVYFDNTFPNLVSSRGSGLTWTDTEGRVHSSYSLFEMREFLKRVRTFFLERGPPPVMMTHMTDAAMVGTLGFADFWLDGENGGYPDTEAKNPDFVDRWYNQVGLANLRITLGRQWGVMPQYLYTWGIEPTYAVLGMFDLENRYTAMGRQPYHEFGRFEKDVEFVPYWTTQPVVKVVAGGPDVLLTAWKRPGQARLLISNLSREDRAVAVKFDLKALNLPEDAVALDEREGSRLAFQDGVARDLEVKAHNYRTIIAARPGLYQPLPPNFGQALQPPRDQWVAGLCDDFSKLDAAWTQTVSPRISLATNDRDVESPAFSPFLGGLKIRTSRYLVARLSRGFNLPNGSVQVKLREPTGQYGAGFGPSLQLVWDPERSIRIAAWEVGPEDKCDRFHCQGFAGKKSLFDEYGEKPRAVNWVKIALKPTTIEFHTSTDGQTWKPLSIQPRTGFEGAPSHVAIGHGGETDGYLEGYSFDSYFGDLIVARN